MCAQTIRDASCFETEEITQYVYNENMTDKEINICATYLESQWGPAENVILNNGTYEDFCRGTALA